MSQLLKTPLAVPDKGLRAIYAATLEELFHTTDNVIGLEADLARSIDTHPFLTKYPDRHIQCGLAEQNLVGVAAGLSSEGYVPFVHSFAAFRSRRAFDQFMMSCAFADLNVKLVGSDAGITTQVNGGSHTANEDIAMMRALPNVTVLDICDAVQLKQFMKQAAAAYGNFYFRLARFAVPRIYADDAVLTIGKAEVLTEGMDVTVIACGIEVWQALLAAEKLAAENISVRVIDMHTIQPLDDEAVIQAARETGAIVTAENHNIHGGLGSAVAECLVENWPVPLERVANTQFGDVGSVAYLSKRFHLDADSIVEKVRKVLTRKTARA